MRVLAGAFLAMFATGPILPGPAGGIAMTLDAHPSARCAVTATATIVAYDATAQPNVAYRFVRSDGTVSQPAASRSRARARWPSRSATPGRRAAPPRGSRSK